MAHYFIIFLLRGGILNYSDLFIQLNLSLRTRVFTPGVLPPDHFCRRVFGPDDGLHLIWHHVHLHRLGAPRGPHPVVPAALLRMDLVLLLLVLAGPTALGDHGALAAEAATALLGR